MEGERRRNVKTRGVDVDEAVAIGPVHACNQCISAARSTLLDLPFSHARSKDLP